MASFSEPRVQAYKAGGTIVADTFVKFGSADDTVVACGAGERAIGVAVEAAASGETLGVQLFGGGAKLKLGATVVRGQILKSNASGQGIKAAAAGDFCAAVAMASGVSGDIIPVELHPVVAAAAE